MKNLIVIAALAALGGCAQLESIPGETYLEVGAGKNSSRGTEWYGWHDGGGVGFYGSLRHEIPVHERVDLVLQYSHYSQWNVGPPFNDTAESSLDHIGGAVRFKVLR